MSLQLKQVLELIEAEEVVSGQWRGLCPVCQHDDRKLYVREEGGRLLMKCHNSGQCEFTEIMEALKDLDCVDLDYCGEVYWDGVPMYPSDPEPKEVVSSSSVSEFEFPSWVLENCEVADTYIYRDELGRPYIARHKLIRGEQKLFLNHYYSNGWQWHVEDGKGGGLPSLLPRIPYNLDKLVSGRDAIYFVEGEKCADELCKRGLLATNSKVWSDRYNYLLKGREVVVIPDCDRAGDAVAKKLAKTIGESAKFVKLVTLPDLDIKEDVYDWFNKYNKNLGDLHRLVGDARSISSGKRIEVMNLLKQPLQAKRWVFTDLIRKTGRDTIILLHGKEKSGKSWVAYAVCLSVVTGTPFMENHQPSPNLKNVLLLSPEGGSGLVQERVMGMIDGMDLSAEQVTAAQDSLFYADLSSTTLDLSSEADRNEVARLIEVTQADMVVLDPLIEFTSKTEGGESDNNIMAKFFSDLRTMIPDEKDVVFLVSHHNRKSTSPNDDSPRGAGAIGGKYDFKVSIKSIEMDEETRSKRMRLRFDARASFPPRPIVMNIQSVTHEKSEFYDKVLMSYSNDSEETANTQEDRYHEQVATVVEGLEREPRASATTFRKLLRGDNARKGEVTERMLSDKIIICEEDGKSKYYSLAKKEALDD